jgi:hypothetical protein
MVSMDGPCFSNRFDMLLATFCSRMSRFARFVTRPYRGEVIGPLQVGQAGGVWNLTGGAFIVM